MDMYTKEMHGLCRYEELNPQTLAVRSSARAAYDVGIAREKGVDERRHGAVVVVGEEVHHASGRDAKSHSPCGIELRPRSRSMRKSESAARGSTYKASSDRRL